MKYCVGRVKSDVCHVVWQEKYADMDAYTGCAKDLNVRHCHLCSICVFGLFLLNLMVSDKPKTTCTLNLLEMVRMVQMTQVTYMCSSG